MKYVSNKTNWTESMKDYVESVLTKRLERLVDDPLEAEVKVSCVKDSIKVDLSIGSFRVQCTNEDFYVAFAEAAMKMKKIVTKAKETQHHFEQLNLLEHEEVEELFTKEKSFVLAPMSAKTAIDEFEKTDYPFFAFRDEDEEDVISIIYRRAEGSFGVIRCR